MNQPMTSLPPNFRFSQSSLQDYSDCPRRFQLRYLERLDYPAMETEPALENERRLEEGAAFHRLAQQYLAGIPAEKLAPLANTPNLQGWWDNFLDFCQAGLPKAARLLPEVTLSARLGDFRLLAKYDLLALPPDGRALIYDWKTYRHRPRPERLAARWQTRVYRALLWQAGAHLNQGKPFAAESIEMIYWLANAPHEAAHFPYSEAQARRDWDGLGRLAAEIAAAGSFPKTEEKKACLFCTYRSYCGRGVSAGSWEEMEGEEEREEEGFELNFEQIMEIEF